MRVCDRGVETGAVREWRGCGRCRGMWAGAGEGASAPFPEATAVEKAAGGDKGGGRDGVTVAAAAAAVTTALAAAAGQLA